MMNKKYFHLFSIVALLLLSACNRYSQEEEIVISYGVENNQTASSALVLPQQDPYMLRTSFRANDLDLETPLRCNVNWKTQEMVQILPHNNVSFRIDRNDINDPLPKFEVKILLLPASIRVFNNNSLNFKCVSNSLDKSLNSSFFKLFVVL